MTTYRWDNRFNYQQNNNEIIFSSILHIRLLNLQPERNLFFRVVSIVLLSTPVIGLFFYFVSVWAGSDESSWSSALIAAVEVRSNSWGYVFFFFFSWVNVQLHFRFCSQPHILWVSMHACDNSFIWYFLEVLSEVVLSVRGEETDGRCLFSCMPRHHEQRLEFFQNTQSHFKFSMSLTDRVISQLNKILAISSFNMTRHNLDFLVYCTVKIDCFLYVIHKVLNTSFVTKKSTIIS